MFYPKFFIFLFILPLFFLSAGFSFEKLDRGISIPLLFGEKADTKVSGFAIFRLMLLTSAYAGEEDDDDGIVEESRTVTAKSSSGQTTSTDGNSQQNAGNSTQPAEADSSTQKADTLPCPVARPGSLHSSKQIRSYVDDLEMKLSNLASEYKRDDSNETNREEIEKKQRSCRKEKNKYEERLSQHSQCTEGIEKAEKARADFSKDCAKFSGGSLKCSSAIQACEMCPSEEDFDNYDCVKIHQKTKCPSLSGEDLKSAKEKRDKINEELKELEEGIAELEEDIVEKENDLNKDLSDLETEFTEANRELEQQVEEQKADLEAQLKQTKSQITEAVSKAIAKVQAEIDNSLKIAHSFENAITQAYMDYRKEKRQIILECETQAQGRLAKFRQDRRRLIQSGSLQMSLSTLMKKGRTSFARKDLDLLKKYNIQCLSKRKSDFQTVEKIHKQKMRAIEQQKEQYQANLSKIKQQVTSLNNQAVKEQSQLVQEYATNMNKILERYNKEYQFALNRYLEARDKLLLQTKNITVLKKHHSQKNQLKREKQMELVRETEQISYLKSKGVSSEEDQKDQFVEAAGSYATYEEAVQLAHSDCSCSDKDKKSLDKECKRIKGYKGSLGLESSTEIDPTYFRRNSNSNGDH